MKKTKENKRRSPRFHRPSRYSAGAPFPARSALAQGSPRSSGPLGSATPPPSGSGSLAASSSAARLANCDTDSPRDGPWRCGALAPPLASAAAPSSLAVYRRALREALSVRRLRLVDWWRSGPQRSPSAEGPAVLLPVALRADDRPWESEAEARGCTFVASRSFRRRLFERVGAATGMYQMMCADGAGKKGTTWVHQGCGHAPVAQQ